MKQNVVVAGQASCRRLFVLAAVLLSGIVLTGCERNGGQPPRANDQIEIKPEPSLISVPVDADLNDLSSMLERRLPRQLWGVDKSDQTCVNPKAIDIGIAEIKTPKIKCHITGSVTHRKIIINGSGETIKATIPLHAAVRVEGAAGVYETATAEAIAHATIRLSFARDWTPHGTVKLNYNWTDTPHVDLLGQRIDLTEQADAKLRPLIAKLERELPGELGKLGVRKSISNAWASAFTVVSLNAENPQVWMRITPQALQYGGYRIDEGHLRLRLGMRAVTETHVGYRPAPPAASPLPPLERLANTPGDVSFFIPVFADYHVLEPVLMQALRKRSVRPFDVPGFDPVRARFDRVRIYGTENGKIAVGLTFAALEQGSGKPTYGTVWMTGKPVTQTNSRRVGFDDLRVSGTTDMTGGDLILSLANAPGVTPMIATMLAQNFEKDYVKLIGKIDRSVSTKKEGDLLILANLTEARTGQLQAAGKGLYLPVWARGTVAINLSRSANK
jgi:hypothetical protein